MDGADFFGITSPGLDAGIAFLHVVGLALAAWGLWLVIRRFFSCEDRIGQILALGILINVGAYLLSTTPTTYWSAREMAGVLPRRRSVLAGRMLGGKFLAFRLGAGHDCGPRVLPGGARLARSRSRPGRPSPRIWLTGWWRRHLTYGLGGYGVGNATSLATAVRSASGR